MQNNELMNRLLGETIEKGLEEQKLRNSSNQSSQYSFHSEQSIEETDLAEIRIISARYKVYIVIILILMYIFGINLIPDIQDSYKEKKSVYSQTQAQLTLIQSEISAAEADTVLLSEIEDNETNIILCLNKRQNCSEFPESWNQDLSVPLSYLQASSLHSIKMAVDEKKVLRNLDSYLIRKEIWASNSRNGEILKIVIWDPKAIKDTNEHFFEVPVSVTIEFENIWWLTWFLYNIEKQIIEEPTDRILYKVQSVSYDVIAANEPQVADISMIAYYYYDEKFENFEETAEAGNIEVESDENENLIDNTETQDSQDIKSDSIESNKKLKNRVWSFIDGLFWK